MGLRPVKDAPCLYTSDHLIVFFYVDDIVTMCKTRDLAKLAKKYKIRRLGDLKWFLGVRIVRDRSNRRLWLCQVSYIDNVVKKFDLATNGKYPVTPRTTELLPYTGEPCKIRTKTGLSGGYYQTRCMQRPFNFRLVQHKSWPISSLWIAHNLNARVAAVAVRKLVGWGDGQEKIKGEGGSRERGNRKGRVETARS